MGICCNKNIQTILKMGMFFGLHWCDFSARSFSAASNPTLWNPQLSSDWLSGTAELQGPAQHPTCHLLLVQGQPANEPAPSFQRNLSNQLAHRSSGETNKCVCMQIKKTRQMLHTVVSCKHKDASAELLFGLIQGSIPDSSSRTRQDRRHFTLKRALSNNRGLLVGFSLPQEFKSVAKEDTGRYSCLASNGVGLPKMCEAKHMTIGVCVCVSTLNPTSSPTPFSTRQNQGCSGEEKPTKFIPPCF